MRRGRSVLFLPHPLPSPPWGTVETAISFYAHITARLTLSCKPWRSRDSQNKAELLLMLAFNLGLCICSLPIWTVKSLWWQSLKKYVGSGRHSSYMAKFANYLLTFDIKFNFFTEHLVGPTIISKLGRLDKEFCNQWSHLNAKLGHIIASSGSTLIRIQLLSSNLFWHL